MRVKLLRPALFVLLAVVKCDRHALAYQGDWVRQACRLCYRSTGSFSDPIELLSIEVCRHGQDQALHVLTHAQLTLDHIRQEHLVAILSANGTVILTSNLLNNLFTARYNACNHFSAAKIDAEVLAELD